ncbi:MAG: phosphoenolpyruvate-utilizing N-terminal domain-containing protein, partial [Antricoccus sp.]
MADRNPTSQAMPRAAGSLLAVQGTPVVQGIALGPAITISASLDLSQLPTDVSDCGSEKSRYTQATDTVAERLRARSATAHGVAAEVLLAQVALVKDKGLAKAAVKAIEAGSNAEHATNSATEQFIGMFDKLGGLMAERTTDLLDLRDRVICELMGEPEPGVLTPDVPSILFADDLAPADTALLDPTRIVALVTRLGGPTSHTAIIARQLGLPCIVAAPFGDIEPGTMVLINGGNGQIEFDPDLEVAQALIDGDLQTRAAAEAWCGPGRT